MRHVTDRRPDRRPLFPIFSVYVARREDSVFNQWYNYQKALFGD